MVDMGPAPLDATVPGAPFTTTTNGTGGIDTRTEKILLWP
jgi:hypothetical protein